MRGRRSSAFFMRDGRASDRRARVADRLLAGRRPRLQRCHAAEEMLAELDVPYIAAQPVEFQTLEQWGASERGLLPVEATIMVAIPELDGATGPMVFGGRSDEAGVACTGCHRGCTFIPASATATCILHRARRDAGRPDRQAGRAAPDGAGRAQGRDRAVQLPAQCRRHRHRRLSGGVRIAASHARRA